MNDYERLNVWRDAHVLVMEAYSVSASFPATERYGLTSQLRRAAVSIPANIAEGAGRRTGADFRRFLDIASGSCNEVEYYARLAADLKLIAPDERDSIRRQVREIRRQLVGLSATLGRR